MANKRNSNTNKSVKKSVKNGNSERVSKSTASTNKAKTTNKSVKNGNSKGVSKSTASTNKTKTTNKSVKKKQTTTVKKSKPKVSSKEKIVQDKPKKISQIIKEIDAGEYKPEVQKLKEEDLKIKKRSKKKTSILLVFAFLFIFITFGVSYAYFASKLDSGGEGISATSTTVMIDNTEVRVNGEIAFDDLNIYPGHKNISILSVTATGSQEITYDLIWTGENTLNTALKYYIYKTERLESPTISCEPVIESSSSRIYYENCT